MKKIIITILGIITAGITPVMPEDMELAYSYSFDYAESIEIQTSTSTKTINEYPFPDSDNDGKGYASVFIDNNGNKVIVEITEQQYKKMGKKGGFKDNTKKAEYLSVIEFLRPKKAEAAIAFDAQSTVAATTGTSLTFAHTTTGTDRMIFANYHSDTGSDLITGITYNSVSMTQVGSSIRVPSDRYMGMYFLRNPASGSNNVVLTGSSSAAIRASAISFTGVFQSGAIDSSNTGTNSSQTGISVSTTSVADNAWTMLFAKDNNGGVTYAGETMRLNADAGGHAVADSNAPITPAGSTSLSLTSGASANHGAIIVSFAPSVASDTCTAPASGDWYVRATDNCYVSTNTTINGGLYLLSDEGQGSFNVIDNAVLSVGSINSTSTPINVESGSKIEID